MQIDENEFFRQATMRICGSLNIETALNRSFEYIRNHLPLTEMHLLLFDPGLDLVRTNLVQTIEVKNGVVRVGIDLPEDHQFASAIKEEIVEKLETLWDVNEVKVEFTE